MDDGEKVINLWNSFSDKIEGNFSHKNEKLFQGNRFQLSISKVFNNGKLVVNGVDLWTAHSSSRSVIFTESKITLENKQDLKFEIYLNSSINKLINLIFGGNYSFENSLLDNKYQINGTKSPKLIEVFKLKSLQDFLITTPIKVVKLVSNSSDKKSVFSARTISLIKDKKELEDLVYTSMEVAKIIDNL